MKEILKFSDYCIPVNEIRKRRQLRNDSFLYMMLYGAFYIWIPPILMILTYYILDLLGHTDFFIFAIFFIFILIHFYSFYFKKMVPYLFPSDAFFQNLMLRGLYPFVIIFIPINTEISFYPLIVGIVFSILDDSVIEPFFIGTFKSTLNKTFLFFNIKFSSKIFFINIKYYEYISLNRTF